jgi:hypothetical protein
MKKAFVESRPKTCDAENTNGVRMTEAIVQALLQKKGKEQTPNPLPLKVCLIPRLSLAELIYLVGLVRTLRSRKVDVMVITHRQHAPHVRALYGDIPGVRFTFLSGWSELHDEPVLGKMQDAGYELLPLSSYRTVCPYAVVGLPSSVAGTEFNIERAPHAEKALLDRVRAEVGDSYVVVHDKPGRRLRAHLLPDALPLVRVDDPRFRAASPFEWIQVMDHALQLHAVDSCFLMLANILALRPRKFCHAYTDGNMAYRPSVYGDAITIWG